VVYQQGQTDDPFHIRNVFYRIKNDWAGDVTLGVECLPARHVALGLVFSLAIPCVCSIETPEQPSINVSYTFLPSRHRAMNYQNLP
jgi:hypothetical protein